jgi:hypothetical protein
MNVLILIFFLAFSSFLGYRKGIIKIIFSLSGLLTAYILAWLLTIPAGNLLISMNLAHGLLAYIVPGTLIFLFSTAGFSIAGLLTHRAFIGRRKRMDIPRTFWLSGSVVNTFTGLIYALALIWSLGQLQTNSRRGWIERASSSLMGSLSRMATSQLFEHQPELRKQVSELIANPRESAVRLKTLTEAPAFSSFFRDPDIQKDLEANNASRLIEKTAFKEMLKDPSVSQQLEHFGLYNKEQGGQEAFARKIIVLWKQATKLNRNARAHEILNSPDYAQLLKENNLMAILGDNRTLELISILGQPEHQGEEYDPDQTSDNIRYPEYKSDSDETDPPIQSKTEQKDTESNSKEQSHKLYSWRDENGQWFISDHPPPGEDSKAKR